jgi:hypothetical protein
MIIQPDNCRDFLDRFHGFHDARYGTFQLTPDPQGTGLFHGSILLLAYDYLKKNAKQVELRLDRIREFKLNYSERFDYPNVRDEVDIAFYEHQGFINFGSATEASQSPEDVRAADMYFVCDQVAIVVDGSED